MKRRSKFFLLIAAVILLFFLNATLVGGLIRAKFLNIIAPISRSFIFVFKAKNAFSSFLNTGTILREKENFAKRVIELEEELVTLRALNEDFKKTAAAYDFSERRGFSMIAARVIGRTVDGNSTAFVIDKGKSDGVNINQAVIIGDGVLAGKIIQAEDKQAIFLFLTDEQARFTAAISGKSGAVGEARGRLGSSLTLEFIPRALELKSGDILVTAGLENNIPSGLLIGRVLEVFEDKTNPLERALVQPAATFADLGIVNILK